MTLTLPADAEPFIPVGASIDNLHNAGVYALRLTRPDDVTAAWDRVFDHRPTYMPDLVEAKGVVYVGAASDVLRRLEEHRDGEKRKAALLEICEIDSLRNIWWFADKNTAFERESKLAITMQNHHPEIYVHQR